MPTVIPESDAFVATIQRPSNGELADAASISLYAQHFANSRRYLYNRTRTQLFDVTRAPFNANPAGTSDSTAAIQAADAAASALGGHVFLPPGSYRHDDSLQRTPGVSWFGVPDATFLNINHATKPQLVFGTGSSRKGLTETSGIGFGALVDNTGDSVSISNDLKLLFQNCTWNEPGSGGSPKLKGRFLMGQGTGTIVEYDDCWLKAIGTVTALFLSSSNGELRLKSGNKLFMPATYTGPLIDIDDGTLTVDPGNTLDVTAHGGSADIIQLLSLGYHTLRGVKFLGAFSSGACIRTLSGGIKISETGSVFDVVNPYNLAGALVLGSELTLSNPIASTIGGPGTTCATGYRAQSFRVTSTAPTFNLPDILFIGQEFDVTVLNDSGAPWAGIAFNGGVGTLGGSTPTGQARTYKWRAMDPKATGTPVWTLIGDPSSAFVVP